MDRIQRFSSDVLVIGGGIAGLFAAITARGAGASVTLVEKNHAGKSGASIMGSGQLNVFNADWGMDLDACVAQISRVCEYLVNRDWLETMLRESWGVYEDLRDWGVEFPCEEKDFRRYMNLVHDWEQEEDAGGEAQDGPPLALGMIPLKHREIPPKLRKWALKQGVRVVDRVMVSGLLRGGGQVCGALGFSIDSGEACVFTAGAVVMAAGKNNFRSPGMNIAELTGDADAMAYLAGADTSGKEFPDMHINIARDPVWKGNGELYPAYWGFVDGAGRAVPMRGFDLAMASVIHAGRGPVVWDFEHMTEQDVKKVDNYIKKRGQPFESERVGLGYHTRKNEKMIGGAAAGSPAEQTAGIWVTGLDCASTLPGLFAAGDCCCSWSWGAISAGAPPGLLPAGVTGKRSGRAAAQFAMGLAAAPEPENTDALLGEMYAPLRREGGYDPRWVCQLLQSIMTPYYVIQIKHGDRLRAALTNVAFLRDHMTPRLTASDPHGLRLCIETRNMVLNAEMILRSSLAREESRGWHYREDYPRRDDENWLAWTRMRRGESGMELEREPIPERWLTGMDPDPAARYPERWLAWEREKEGC